MTTATITEQYILDAIQQETQGEQFPILFDEIWQSSGYTLKHNAVRFLKKRCTGLKENEHYLTVSKRMQVDGAWVSTHEIYLSLKAYRFFLSKSNTEQGDANLWYLIEVENQYRKNLERQLAASVQPQVDLKEFEAKIRKEEQTKVLKNKLYDLEFASYQIKSVEKENKKLNLELDEKYTVILEQLQRLKEAEKQIEQLTELNEKLSSDDYFEQVSPDLRIRRGYWAELTSLYSKHKKLEEENISLKKLLKTKADK